MNLSTRKRIHKTFFYTSLCVIAFIMAFPLVFMFVSSFKTDTQIYADIGSIRAFLPMGDLVVENYEFVLKNAKVGQYFFNSFIITTVTVCIGTIINALAAFYLSRHKFKGKTFLIGLVLSLLIVPFEAIAIPMLIWVSKLPMISFDNGFNITQGWLNTHWVQMAPFMAYPLYIYLFYQSFRDIPIDFDEAAHIDGANSWQVFRIVIVPMAKPAFATVVILHALFMWNQYLWPILVSQSDATMPIMVGIGAFQGNSIPWGAVLAYASLITVPVLLVYIIFQKWFIQSFIGAGVKG